MLKAINQFDENIVRVRSMGGLHKAISTLMTSAIDSTDILRAEFVLALSALDCYIHQIAMSGMLEIFDGKRASTVAYENFRLPIVTIASVNIRESLEAEIRRQHGFVAFQHPDKIGDAIRLISNTKIWEAISVKLNQSSRDIKERLKLIVDRRNKIAHEADLNPTYPNSRWPISLVDVEEVVDFIERLVHAIHLEVC